MPKNGILGLVSEFMPQSNEDIELDLEQFFKLVTKVKDEGFSNKERKLLTYLTLLDKLNLILAAHKLKGKSYYPIAWDDKEYDNGIFQITEQLNALSMICSAFSDITTQFFVMDICNEIMQLKYAELNQEIDCLKKHAQQMIDEGRDSDDELALNKGLELLRRACEIEAINNMRKDRKNDELYFFEKQNNTKTRQEYFSNQVSSILYPVNQYQARYLNRTVNHQNQVYLIPVIKGGEDFLASHRGYRKIAANIANILFKPVGLMVGIYKFSSAGNYDPTLFSTKTKSEKIRDQVNKVANTQSLYC